MYNSNFFLSHWKKRGWNLPDYEYSGVSISTQNSSAQGIYFRADGLKLYEVDFNLQLIYQYSLTTPFQLNSATYETVSPELNVSAMQGLFFKPDGTKVYVIDSGADQIRQYTINTAWDISTLDVLSSVLFNQEGANSTDLFFSPDGTKMYTVNYSSANVIYQYTLSTAWDLSTTTYDNVSFAYQGMFNRGVFFKPDGKKMFTIEYNNTEPTGIFYQYTLSTAWDISTATYDNISKLSQYKRPSGLFFSPDGKYMYEVNVSTIYQYNLK